MIMQRFIYLASLFFFFYCLGLTSFLITIFTVLGLGLREVAGVVIGAQLILTILLSLTILLEEKRN